VLFFKKNVLVGVYFKVTTSAPFDVVSTEGGTPSLADTGAWARYTMQGRWVNNQQLKKSENAWKGFNWIDLTRRLFLRGWYIRRWLLWRIGIWKLLLLCYPLSMGGGGAHIRTINTSRSSIMHIYWSLGRDSIFYDTLDESLRIPGRYLAIHPMYLVTKVDRVGAERVQLHPTAVRDIPRDKPPLYLIRSIFFCCFCFFCFFMVFHKKSQSGSPQRAGLSA
jgi:hypothetical protein